MKNILILSVTAGEGHNSTAKAIKAELESRGADCTILDTFNYVSKELARFISEGYLFVTERAKYAYKVGYRIAEKRKRSEFGMKIVDHAIADDIGVYINSGGYDTVIYTHPFAGTVVDILLEKHVIDCLTVGILTDFTFHPYWEECTRSDYVVIPDRLLTPQGMRKGFLDSQLLPLGIPINPKFSSRMSKEEARRTLSLDETLPTFLLMGGSMGYGNIAETLAQVDECNVGSDFQLAVVCGNNSEMREEAEKTAARARHRVSVMGFVDYIPTLMDASDFIITKPGGLTTSESLAKTLPMIIVNPIPGQEERNSEFLTNNGCAMAATKTCPIDECIYTLLTSKTRLETMRRSIGEIAKPNSTRDLCEFIMR